MTNTGRPDWCRREGAGYVTTAPILWAIGKKNSGWVLCIPAGFAFESSVPRWLWWAFSPDDPAFLKAACVHDRLLLEGYRRAFADSQWLDAARSEHAPVWRREVAFLLMQVRCAFLGKWR